MPRVADRTKDTGLVTGTGAVTLDNTSSPGLRTFGSAFGPLGYPVVVWYAIEDQTPGAWEVGYGTLTSATNLNRDGAVTGSSNADAKVTFGAATAVHVYSTASADVIEDAQPGRMLAQRNNLAGL